MIRTSVPESTVSPAPGSCVATRPSRPLAALTSDVPLSTSTRFASVAAAFARRPVIRIHRDTFELPSGAALLATGGGYPQVFRIGSALGIQPHPEVTPDILADWLVDGDARQIAIEAGTDPEAIVDAFRLAQPSVEAMAADVFDAWIDEVTMKTLDPRR